MSADSIPVIDLAPSFASEAGRENKKVAAANPVGLRDDRFLHHRRAWHPRRPWSIAITAKATSRAFFALPLADKQRTPQPVEKISRGYSHVASRGLAYSTGAKKTPPDLQESLAMGPVDDEAPAAIRGTDAERLFFMRNLWPAQPSGLQGAFEDYYRAMEGLSLHLLRLFARALALDAHFFDDKVRHHTSTMRVIHYPPQAGAPRGSRAAARR